MLNPLYAHPNGLAQTVCNPDGNQNGQNNDRYHQNGNDDDVAIGTGHKVRRIGVDAQAPAVSSGNRSIGQIFGHAAVLVLTKPRLTGSHLGF